MRKAVLMMSALLSLTLAACAVDSDPPDESQVESKTEPFLTQSTADDPTKEKWCNSFPQSHCPTNVCAWQPTPAPGKCTLLATE